MTAFISLAISDTMFPAHCTVKKTPLTPDEVKAALHHDLVVSALNPSHKATIDVIRKKYGIALPIPIGAPKVSLGPGDKLIVLQAQLPRLMEGEVHSAETVENCVVKFSCWTIL